MATQGAIGTVLRRASRGARGMTGAKALDTMRHSGSSRNLSRLTMPRSGVNYAREVGDGTTSSVVMLPLQWLMTTFPEAPIVVDALEGEQWVPVVDHPMTALIDTPNPFYDGELLRMASTLDYNLTGNAYWLKMRGGMNRAVELWWAPSTTMEPRWDKTGETFITHYDYKPDPTMRKPIEVEPENVVHFRFGMDPRNPRKGLSRLAAVLREIYTDDEAAAFTASILRNFGVPGVVIAPSGGDTDVDAELIKAVYKDKFSGDKRGEPMVLEAPGTVSVVSWSPEQMNLRELRKIPEERVSGALGVPAIVAGLGAGLDRSTFANTAEAREMAYESNIIPTQRTWAGVLRRQLLDDFDVIENRRVRFDNSEVRVLQEDADKRAARLRADATAGLILLSEYRAEMGMPTDESHDIYLRPLNLLEIPAGASGNVVEADGAPKRRGVRFTDIGAVKAPRRNPATFVRTLERARIGQQAAFQQALTRRFRALGTEARAAFTDRVKAAPAARGRKAEDDPNWPQWLLNIANGDLPVELLLPESVEAGVAAEYVAGYTAVAASTFDLVSDYLGATVGFDLDDPAGQRILATGGTNAGLVDIPGQTRDAIAKALADGRADGDSIAQLARRIQSYVSGDALYPKIAAERGSDAAAKYRATVIARTESKNAQNLSSILAYGKSDVVDGVLVFDGDGCGWTGHDDSDLADGSRRSLDDALSYPLAHPQCVRSFAPLVRGE